MERKQGTDTQAESDRRKRRYRKPELIEFGNVNELTRGGTGPSKEPLGKRRL